MGYNLALIRVSFGTIHPGDSCGSQSFGKSEIYARAEAGATGLSHPCQNHPHSPDPPRNAVLVVWIAWENTTALIWSQYYALQGTIVSTFRPPRRMISEEVVQSEVGIGTGGRLFGDLFAVV